MIPTDQYQAKTRAVRDESFAIGVHAPQKVDQNQVALHGQYNRNHIRIEKFSISSTVEESE